QRGSRLLRDEPAQLLVAAPRGQARLRQRVRRTCREPRAATRRVRTPRHRAIGRTAAPAVVRRVIADPPVVARLRAQLVDQISAPFTVSATSNQYYFNDESAAYNEIEVRQGEAFAVVVVRGALPS